MRRVVTALVVLLGTLAIVAGLALAVALTPVAASDAGAGAALVALVGVALALAKLSRPVGDEGTVAPAPWTEDGALVAGTPEETTAPAEVTGAELAALVDDACERAREAETVEEGFDVVRPPLRETVTQLLLAAGTDPDAADDALASGAWTDDDVAAAVVDERVQRPSGSLRERVRAWLFPERVVRRETARAVGAIADAADEALPPVVGQRAPRTVPTLAPALGTLQRAADGTLQRASGSPATDTGEPSASNGAEPETNGSPTDGAKSGADDPGSDSGTLVEEVWDDA